MHDSVNQQLLPREGKLALDSQPEMEATIVWLRQQFETVRQHEIKRLRGRLGALNSRQESAIESLTHRIIDQILETPISALRAISDDDDSFRAIDTVHRVFNLTMVPRLRLWLGGIQ